jgi:lysophospholipase L1-like esterase
MKFRNGIVYFLISIVLFSFLSPERKIKIYIIGDSTAAIKEINAYPETGWGMPFAYMFDSTVSVDNRAKNGRSTRTFISENLWQPIADNLKEGDYVFMQFGHNDESKEKTDRYTTPEEYKRNLVRFINETKAKKAIPVLMTPVTRRQFDAAGNIKETHEVYSALVKEVAAETKVLFIDMDEKTKALLQTFGVENSKLLFLKVAPGEHPNYPNGKDDNTHFNELGARKVAQIVLQEIRNLNIELANRIYKGKR